MIMKNGVSMLKESLLIYPGEFNSCKNIPVAETIPPHNGPNSMPLREANPTKELILVPSIPITFEISGK
jgi:hypothetical protein